MVFGKRKSGASGSKAGNSGDGFNNGGDTVKILRKGPAMRVIFFYPGEEGTYVDNSEVTLYENGIVHIRSPQEETTTHLQNCEILWTYETETDDRKNKVRLLKIKPKSSQTSDSSEDGSGDRDAHAPNSEL